MVTFYIIKKCGVMVKSLSPNVKVKGPNLHSCNLGGYILWPIPSHVGCLDMFLAYTT
jgi:hypothetical protein